MYKGAARSDISSVDAVKRSLLMVKSVAYPDPKRGAMRCIHFLAVIERLGISAQVNAKAKLITPPLAEFMARTEPEMVITQP